MKNIIKLMTLLLIMFKGVDAESQFIAKGGLGLTNNSYRLKTTNEVSNTTTGGFGFHLGGSYEIYLSDSFALDPGLQFALRSYKILIENANYKISMLTIEVPVNLKFYFTDSGTIRFYSFTGLYAGINLSTKVEGRALGIGNSSEDVIKGLDFGMNMGLGMEIGERFLIGLSYNQGFANMNPVRFDDKMKTAAIRLNLGYKFN